MWCSFLVVAVASALPANQQNLFRYQRHYDPEESHMDRTAHILMPDGSGGLRYVDLSKDRGVDPKVLTSDVTFYLHTKNNKIVPQKIRATHFQDLQAASHFDRKRSNVFIVHGWTDHRSSPVNKLTTAALLEKHDVNVFVVDWSGPASSVSYVTAKNAVPKVGVIVGNFINAMVTKLKLNLSSFVLVGHSLGAHVAGCAGAQVAKVNGKVRHIVGLDPAGPLFTIENIDNRLDPSDASFVHVIHTNGGLLGFSSAMGHADYYPNGGKSQPGCGSDPAGSCSHSRAYLYFVESVKSPRFHAVLCDSYENFESGTCRSNARSLLGGYAIDTKAKGDFYLKTSNKAPFALGEVY